MGDAATAFKAETEAKHAAMEAEAAALTGKDNKKARQAKSKEAAALKTTPEYIDACRVVKGQQPKNGNFAKAKTAETPKAEAAKAVEEKPEEEAKDTKKKEDKKPKKQESAGISKAERDELEKLKNDIIARKKELKEQGMSGGQMNKDEQVVAWVARMNELKEKESPGSTTAGGKKDDKDAKKEAKANKTEEKMALEAKIEEYRQQLIAEFKYTAKEIKADPDMADMLKQLAKMK